MKKFFLKNNSGFSLLEVMFVVALLGLFAGIAGPVYRAVQTQNDLSMATISLVQALRRAQSLAESGKADSSWGVLSSSTLITVYSGNSYATRQASLDEKINLPGGITVSGTSETVFNKFTGFPISLATTTLSNSFGSKNININMAGTISY